jgi:serine O-acetyltransferase
MHLAWPLRGRRVGIVGAMARLREVLRLPLAAPMLLTDQRETIGADVARWNEILGISGLLALLWMPEFRSLYFYRLSYGNRSAHLLGRVLACLYRPESTLHIATMSIGPGLFIQHGFATIITAERIGANCWINQQVTIGYRDRTRAPVIEDDVVVHAGAKIIGDITVGAGSTIGANAVVIADVPPRHTAVGVPARYIAKTAKPAERPRG